MSVYLYLQKCYSTESTVRSLYCFYENVLSFGQTYKQAVLKVVPHLQFLDQKPLTAEAEKQGCLMSQSSLLRYLIEWKVHANTCMHVHTVHSAHTYVTVSMKTRKVCTSMCIEKNEFMYEIMHSTENIYRASNW